MVTFNKKKKKRFLQRHQCFTNTACSTCNLSLKNTCVMHSFYFYLIDFMCSQPVPNRTVECNKVDCPAFWTVGNWSDVSVHIDPSQIDKNIRGCILFLALPDDKVLPMSKLKAL